MSGDGVLITPDDVATGVLVILARQVGRKEDPETPNAGVGPEGVNEYLASVNLPPGNQWCAAFTYWVWMKATAALFTKNLCPKTGSCIRMWELGKKYQTSLPEPGCIYVADHGGRKGHVGIVEAVGLTGIVTEISGNTNAAGSRVGNCVARHSWRAKVGENVHGGRLLGYLNLTRVQSTLAAGGTS